MNLNQLRLLLSDFLNQPFTLKKSLLRMFYVSFAYGSFVAFFLIVFKPFDLTHLPAEILMEVGLKYGLITFIVVFINTFLKRYLGFKVGKWNNRLELLTSVSTLIQIGFFNALFASIDLNAPFPEMFWKLQMSTFKLGILPIFLEIILERNRYLSRYLKEVERKQANSKKSILLKDLRGNSSKVELKNIILIKSDGHYLRIFTQHSFFYVRETMAIFYDRLDGGIFKRVHRSSIVNIDHIEGLIKINRKRYSLKMSNGQKVNISESYRNTIKQYLELNST